MNATNAKTIITKNELVTIKDARGAISIILFYISRDIFSSWLFDWPNILYCILLIP